MHAFNEKLKDLCLKLFDIGALKFGDFKMKVGINSPVYFDLRVIVSYPAIMDELSTLVWQFAQHLQIKPKLICGVPYTALPIATIVCVKANIPMCIRRKEPKNYGTMKLIEGKYSAGEECLIIEDTVTSGSSILETAKDLKHDGLLVKDAIVVIDREQGGALNLVNNNVQMHSLMTLTKAMDILHSHGKLDIATVDRVKQYLRDNQILPDGRPITASIPSKSRLTMPFSERIAFSKCEAAKNLFTLMERKKSNLCVAIDVSTSNEFLSLVRLVGEYACVIKSHYDAIADWNDDTRTQLLLLSKQLDFMVMEDRKFGDIGNTVSLQCNNIFNWASLATMHSVAGAGSLEGVEEAVRSHPNAGVFLVAELSSKDSLINAQYTKATYELAVKYNSVVVGLVCQNSKTLQEHGMLQLTPGVSLKSGEDHLGQVYVPPEEAVISKGGDIIVVGRAITKSNDPKVTAKELKDKLWEAYLQRIS